jgi:diadenosine tetraphosphate (Ap4A) HIT family hydrolase
MNSNYDENNIFAKILKSEIDCKKINENDYALAFLDINPQAPIHILIIPKNHYVNMYDFNKNASSIEILSFWELVNSIIDDQGIKNNGFRVISNSGKDGNQDVSHFHLHILGGKNLGRMIKLSS